MTIDEAIRDLELIKNPLWGTHSGNWMVAVEMGMEALKRCQILSKNDTYWAKRTLQGETK